MDQPRRHHIWCNEQNPLFPEAGVETCTMCPDLYKNYPLLPGDEPVDLMHRHFPNNRRVGE